MFWKARFVYIRRRIVSVPEDLLELVSLGVAAGLVVKIQAPSVGRPKVSY